MIKTENQFYADLISFIRLALKSFNVKGWNICQLTQPVKFTNLKPAVYVKIQQISQRGTQFTRKKLVEGKLSYVQAYKEEVSVQISAYRSRILDDTVETLTPKDILKFISGWFVSPYGLEQIRKGGYEIYNPSEINSPVLKNDSENFNPMPSFNITFIAEQSWDMPVEDISEYKLKTKGI